MRRIFSIVMTVLLVLQPVGVPLAGGDAPCPMKAEMSDAHGMHHEAGKCCCDHPCSGDDCGLECLAGTLSPPNLPPMSVAASVDLSSHHEPLVDVAIPIGFDRPAFRPPISA